MIPDVTSLVTAHLKGQSLNPFAPVASAQVALIAVVPTARIRIEFAKGDEELMPRPYILVQPAGGPGFRPYTPETIARCDIKCYGATGENAQTVARLVRGVLTPADRTLMGWRTTQGQVLGILTLTEPIPLNDNPSDPEHPWPMRLMTMEYVVAEVAVGA